MLGEHSVEELVLEKMSIKGAQDFLAFFEKKQWKNKYEKVFFQLKVREPH